MQTLYVPRGVVERMAQSRGTTAQALLGQMPETSASGALLAIPAHEYFTALPEGMAGDLAPFAKTAPGKSSLAETLAQARQNAADRGKPPGVEQPYGNNNAQTGEDAQTGNEARPEGVSGNNAANQHPDSADRSSEKPNEIDKQFSLHVILLKQKLPKEWHEAVPNRKGIGFRWQDPNNPGNRIRVDKGNRQNSQKIQQEDHVVVHSNGKIIGRGGRPIKGRIKDDPENAHIPLREYLKWKNWNSPL